MKTGQLLTALLLLVPSYSVSGFSVGTVRRRNNNDALVVVMNMREEEATSGVAAVRPKRVVKNNKQSRVVASAEQGNLPPVLQEIANDRMEFQRKLGKAMDTLRKDMQDILTKTPDYTIYDENIHVIDPSGIRLTGLDKYESAFVFLQTFLGFWFSTSRSGLQFRMVHDFARSSIRISWHAVLVPKIMPLGGKPLYVDGISNYELDRSSGLITEHRIENLLINNRPVAPPYGIFSILQQQDSLLGLGKTVTPQGVPTF